jgi:hypothetical protein
MFIMFVMFVMFLMFLMFQKNFQKNEKIFAEMPRVYRTQGCRAEAEGLKVLSSRGKTG